MQVQLTEVVCNMLQNDFEELKFFLSRLLCHYIIHPVTFMQVAAIQFYDRSLVSMLWNLQSNATLNYNHLSINIWNMQATGGNDGRIEDGFQLALDYIIGKTDRATARNVVLTLGDGGGGGVISNLNEMIQKNDR